MKNLYRYGFISLLILNSEAFCVYTLESLDDDILMEIGTKKKRIINEENWFNRKKRRITEKNLFNRKMESELNIQNSVDFLTFSKTGGVFSQYKSLSQTAKINESWIDLEENSEEGHNSSSTLTISNSGESNKIPGPHDEDFLLSIESIEKAILADTGFHDE